MVVHLPLGDICSMPIQLYPDSCRGLAAGTLQTADPHAWSSPCARGFNPDCQQHIMESRRCEILQRLPLKWII